MNFQVKVRTNHGNWNFVASITLNINIIISLGYYAVKSQGQPSIESERRIILSAQANV
jgi:hypothetical protein